MHNTARTAINQESKNNNVNEIPLKIQNERQSNRKKGRKNERREKNKGKKREKYSIQTSRKANKGNGGQKT